MQKKTIKDAINDPNISATSLGIYLWLVHSYSDDNFIPRELVEDRFANGSIKVSKNVFNKAFNELLGNEYLRFEKIKFVNFNGDIEISYDYVLNK
jgi:hypothetical protein